MRVLFGCTLGAAVEKKVASVAQLVEQRIRNAKVGCSIPLTGTTSQFRGVSPHTALNR